MQIPALYGAWRQEFRARERKDAVMTSSATSTTRRGWWRRHWRWPVGGLIVLVLLFLLFDYFLYPGWVTFSGPLPTAKANGLWLRYTWYFGQAREDEYAALRVHLRQGHIHDLYAHVRHIRANGHLKFHYPAEGRRFTDTMHRTAPGTRVFAWIYVDRKDVCVADPTIRRAMVAEAVWLVRQCGFDGIQWDYEVSLPGDSALLRLLEDTRKALPQAPLSVCTGLWYPMPVTHWYGWNDRTFTNVAARCDQVVVMGYDSGVFLPRAYVAFLHRQVVHVTRAVAAVNPRCRVLIGVPTYDEGGGWGHDPHVENLTLALKGVRDGVTDPQAMPQALAGVALFADYTTSSEEWQTLARDWAGTER